MRKNTWVHLLACVVGVCLVTACTRTVRSTSATPVALEPVPSATLRVAMFPYIPDSGADRYTSLVAYIERNFEQRYPTIDLVLRPLNPEDDFYDIDTLKGWLTSSAEQEGYDIVEVDTVVLGDMVTAGLISPWPQASDSSDWYPVAARSVQINGATYGIPHLLCGYFLMTRSKEAASAKNVAELSRALMSIQNDAPDLVGNMVGSWNMPSLFLDAWSDNHPRASAAYALHAPMDADTLDDFGQFSSLCWYRGQNPCLDGTYDDDKQPALAAEMFALGKADALFGYSERLFFVFSTASDDETILVSPLPMGKGKNPLLFTDAFVLRRDRPDKVEAAARLFTDFMNSKEVQEVLLMSGDVSSTATPRYLLPATQSAFDAPRLKTDRVYQELKKAIAEAEPFPNTGFLNTRKAMRDEIMTFLERP